MSLSFSVNMEWEDPQPTDYSICYECKQMIFGTMHVGHMFFNNEKLKGEMKVCERCRYNNPVEDDR